MSYNITKTAMMCYFSEYKYEVWFEYIDKQNGRKTVTDKVFTTDIDFGIRMLNAKQYHRIPHQIKFGSLEYLPSAYRFVYDKNRHHFSAYSKNLQGKIEELYTIPPCINVQTVAPGDYFVSKWEDVVKISEIRAYYFLGDVKSSTDCKSGLPTPKNKLQKILYFFGLIKNLNENYRKFFYKETKGIIVRKQQKNGKFEIMSEHDDITEEEEKFLLAIPIEPKI